MLRWYIAAMLADMRRFLPVGRALDCSQHGAHRPNPQQNLIGEEGQYLRQRLTPAPGTAMYFHKFVQPGQVNKHLQDEAVERHERQQRHPHGQFYEKEHRDRYRQHQRKE